jgi:outer membrane protein assembly factor BamB
MRPARSRLSAIVLLLAGAAAAAAQPTITGLNSSQRPRSGRLEITGSGFGTGGEVLVAGLQALTSTWTGARLVAYVPEAAPLGPTTVVVVSRGLESNAVPLEVEARRPNGRVLWTFEADGDNLWWRPALAPDGTLYLHTNNDTDGLVFALSSDGALRWIRKVNWFPYAPPTAGPDGAAYVSSIQDIYRLSPEGAIDWVFVDSSAQGVQVGPTIGPDGRLYAAYDFGLGVVALDPASGQLVWSNTGSPRVINYGTLGTEMEFGPSTPAGPIDQLYLHSNNRSGSPLYGFTLGGEQLFANSLATLTSHEPAIGSDGTLYLPHNLDLGIGAFDPDDGSEIWTYGPPGWATGAVDVEIGSDDTLYFVGSLGKLEAYDPIGRRQLWRNSTGEVLGRPTITPDSSQLVLSGVPNYGQPGFIRGYDAATGEETWEVSLPGEPYPGFRVLGLHHPRITPDSGTAYVSTFTVADGSPFSDPHSFLYAVDLGGTSFELTASGSCPGTVEVTIANAPPNTEVGVIAAAGNNGFVKGGSLCNGLVLEVSEPFQLPPTWIRVDSTGTGTATISLGPNRCWLEAIAVAGCGTTAANRVP